METGEEILEKLGYQLSHLSPEQWQQTLVQIKSSLAGKSVADVMRFEPLTQPDAEILVPILYELHVAYGVGLLWMTVFGSPSLQNASLFC